MSDETTVFLKQVASLASFVLASLLLREGLLDLVADETATLLAVAAFLFSFGFWTEF